MWRIEFIGLVKFLIKFVESLMKLDEFNSPAKRAHEVIDPVSLLLDRDNLRVEAG